MPDVDDRPEALPMKTVPGWPLWPLAVVPTVVVLALAVGWRSVAIGLLLGAFPIFAYVWWDWCNRHLVPPFERWLRRRYLVKYGIDVTRENGRSAPRSGDSGAQQ